MDREGSEALLWVPVGLLALAPIVLWRASMDVFSLPKVTVVAIGSVVAIISLTRWWVRRGAIVTPSRAFAVGILIFLLAGVFGVIRSPLRWASLMGQYGRWSGFTMYASLAVVAVATATAASFARQAGRYLIRSMLLSSGVVGIYAILQHLGMDPFQWQDLGLPGTFSTMGNVNFASAYLGIAAPLAVVEVADQRAARAWRWTASAVFLVCLFGLAVASSLQGPLVLGVGLLIVLLGVAVGRSERLAPIARRPSLMLATTVVAVAGLAGAVALLWERLVGAAGVGSEARLYFWEAALRMASERPLTGWGFDTFGYLFTRYRPVEHALRFGGTVTDEPHNVWLGMQVSGGLILLLAYLLVIGIVASRIPSALRKAEGQRRLEVVGLIAAWVGYQLQSLISIDQPALAAVHWVLAGAIIGLASGPEDRWERPLPELSRRSRRVFSGAPLTVAAVLFGILVSVPFFIDMWAQSGMESAAAAPSPEERLQGFDRLATAFHLAPWTGTYAFRRAELFYESGSVAAAYESQVAAIDRTPGQPRYVMNAANMARQLGEDEASARWWRRAAAIDRQNPDVLRDAADFLEDLREVDAAERLRIRARKLEPDG